MPLIRLDAADTLSNSKGQCRLAFASPPRNRSGIKNSPEAALGVAHRSP